MEENNSKNKFQNFFKEYGGGVIGGVVALLLCFTEIYKLLLYIVIVLAGIVVGNYVQKNKENVKTKLKEFIDKV